MCIDASGKTDFGCASPLVEGDTYTASQCPIYDESYKLVEIPTTATLLTSSHNCSNTIVACMWR